VMREMNAKVGAGGTAVVLVRGGKRPGTVIQAHSDKADISVCKRPGY
jgi:hypothetical protein